MNRKSRSDIINKSPKDSGHRSKRQLPVNYLLSFYMHRMILDAALAPGESPAPIVSKVCFRIAEWTIDGPNLPT